MADVFALFFNIVRIYNQEGGMNNRMYRYNENEVDVHGAARHKPECEMRHQHQGGRTVG